MKKIHIIILSIIFIILSLLVMNFSYAYESTYTIEFEASKVSEDFNLYLLLPKEYILFAIEEDGVDVEYTGVNTLKENSIPSIRVNKNNINDELYEENGEEYIQILLEKNEEGKYEFDILSSYTKMNIKYRIRNIEKDDIVHIDNFKVDNGVCVVQYNYEEDIVKQPDTGVIPFTTKLLIIVLIIIVVIGIIAYVKKRR